MTARYYPEIFNRPKDELEAVALICNPEEGLSSLERWQRETAWLVENIKLKPGATIDFGCGIGRLTKHLPGPVIGVDIAAQMLSMAHHYVQREDCAFMHPNALVSLNIKATNAVAVWVLQHIPEPAEAVNLLSLSLESGGMLWVVDHGKRHLPAVEEDGKFGWISQPYDIRPMIAGKFFLVSCEPMPEELCNPGATFSCWRNR